MADAIPHRRPPPLLDEDCALFLDVDGTLLDFATHPDSVRLPAGALDTIGRLSDRLQGALALVSGRPLEQLDGLFAPLELPAAGLHGQQLRLRAIDATAPAAAPAQEDGAALVRLKREALALAARHPGILVEDKGSNLALHWRTAPEAAADLRALAESHLPELLDYRLQPGDHVIELVPAGIDKGRAVAMLMANPPFRGRTPVFVGDDLTDEFGFTAAHALGGWSVLVGARRGSSAHHALTDPAAVHAWLRANAFPRAATPAR